MIQRFAWTPNGFKIKKNAAVVCFANGRYTYFGIRLAKTIQHWNPEIPVFVYDDYKQIGSPSQEDEPYAFKLHAIETVRNQGYDIVLWCDSVLQLTQPLDRLLQEVEDVGVYLAEDGWKVGQYANDKALAHYGFTRDQAMELPTIWACFMGFDFRNPRTQFFFTKWKEAMNAGLFRGCYHNKDSTESQDPRCKGHRHDQTCAELISHVHGFPFSKPVLSHIPSYDHRYFTGREW
jgi:hypothetical protein